MISSLILFFLCVVLTSQARKGHSSTIRTDLKAFVRFANLEINIFVDASTVSADLEKILLNLFPAVDILRLKRNHDDRVRTSGKSIAVHLGEKTGDVEILVEEERGEEEPERSEKEGNLDSALTHATEKNWVNHTVAITTLDDMLADNGYSTTCPEFIRIAGYGGHELSVLKGALKTLECTKIVCVTGNIMRMNKQMPFAADVISFLNDQGFTMFNIYENQRQRFFNVQVEMMFAKKDLMDEMFSVGFKDHFVDP